MRTPSQDARRTEVAAPPKLPDGLDALAHRAQGRWRRRRLIADGLQAEAAHAHAEAEKLRDLGTEQLRDLLATHAARARRLGARWAEEFGAMLPALAEAAHRQTGLRPYPVQLMGALGLARGLLVEMATGEGKTLTIALAAAPAGWLGRPCHVITANDYLAERDATGLARFYSFCGVRAGFIAAGMSPEQRRENYAREVVYATSKELVADFLRDRLALGPLAAAPRRALHNLLAPARGEPGRTAAAHLTTVTHGLFTAIVDEADNLLIDEAVTPLIISRQQENAALSEACAVAGRLVEKLTEGADADYEVEVKLKDVRLTPAGRERLAELCAGLPGVYQGAGWMAELVDQALRARHFYQRGKQYVIQDNAVVIVDEFTGRLMPGRSWRLGLHQAVEAKEGVPITPPTESLARLSFQKFFRLFRRLSGITGTAREAADEFWGIYELPVAFVPPHRPCVRETWPARYFFTADEKWAAIVDEIATVHASGRPLLVGTRSVAASEHLAALLAERGLAYALLNAVRHREEAGIIHLAGDPHVITLATNMAGRGTDIRLGHGVAALGGLHVILTEPHESGRIDRQLQGRAGRQGDPGSTRTFASLDDELVVRFTPRWQRAVVRQLMEQGPGPGRRAAAWLFRRAQRAAEKQAYRQRKLVTKQDAQLAESLTAGPGEGGS
jgi:preprotein translocase subunit SecA